MSVKNAKPCPFPNNFPNAENLPEKLLKHVALHCPLSPRAMRLLFGIILYAICAGYSDVEKFLRDAAQKKSVNIRCALLTEFIGTDGVRDNRWLAKAAEELAQCTGLFQVIFIKDSTSLVFRISQIFADAIATSRAEKATPQYARVAPADFQFSSGYRVQANLLMRQHVNKKWPSFKLPYIPESSAETAVAENRIRLKNLRNFPSIDEAIAQEVKRRARLRIMEWPKSRNAWLKVLEDISKEWGVSMLVMPRYHPIFDYVSSVTVKLQHAHTQWSEGGLYCAHPGIRMIYEVTPSGRVSLPRKAWKKKHAQVKIY
ncbi:hypothetical protein KUV62_22255 [Salipiger bermudensis]|uniref:hypothetical protein n=1 Tax=Salipiger bermudensis TaxID=344736 RepID=UPI001C997EBD|nr:hypothetical protein [Salipiger bermudensis]MBY6006663.1 hypothetical protein [Salipiger bermudensis]